MTGRTIPVTDLFGRPRNLGVDLSENGRQVLITPPPGEAVLLKPGVVEQLIDALRDARSRAALDGYGRPSGQR